MNGPEHYEVAELLLARSEKAIAEGVAEFYVAQAQVHATLALAAVQVMPMASTPTRHAWLRLLDPSSPYLPPEEPTP